MSNNTITASRRGFLGGSQCGISHHDLRAEMQQGARRLVIFYGFRFLEKLHRNKMAAVF
jgi:hypothetical protein